MKTRRSLASAADLPEAKLKKVAKKAAKKQSGRKVVLNKPKIVIGGKEAGSRGPGRTRNKRFAAAAPPAVAPQQQQQQQQPSEARKRSTRRSSAAAACHAAGGNTTITDLSAETLHEVFLQLASNQSFCREMLPLVCKRFRELLAQPSPVWQTLQINFLEKGAVISSDPKDEDALDAAELGRRQRLLRSAVENWLQPRAKAVKRLLIMFSTMDPTHSFSTGGRGLRRLFTMVAPGLQELRISSCSDIFHGKSFADLVGLQQLQVLAVTCITSKLTAEDLAPLEQLKKLKSLTLHCSKQHEDLVGVCFTSFPEVLFKLKGLAELAFTSTGIMHIPTGITRLKSLTALDISGCPISFLPQNLWRCSELRHVRLNGTNVILGMMHAWEPLVKLPHLETLELRETKTRFLPPALKGLNSLTALDLSDNIFEHSDYNGTDALGCLQHMPALKRLALQRSQMSTVPNVLCHLSGVTHLDLSHNYLVDMVDGLCHMRSLRELVAQGNSFPRIPEVLHKMPSLEVLDLSFCIYCEAALSMDAWAADGFRKLRIMDLRKLLGVWKESSKTWLMSLENALVAQGRPCGVIRLT